MAVDPIRGAGDPQTRVAGTRTAELFEAHSRMVYGLCRALLRDPDDADDATQATFISAHKSLLGGNAVREPGAWLATIARNECAGRARARTREPLPLLDADLAHMRGPEAELDRKAVAVELRHAISELPEKQREAVVLRDLYGLRYTEVGAALGMSVASVESLLFRARRSLRISLKPVVSGALVVPVAVREGIAQALPGFTTASVAGGSTASGAVGLGLLAKLSGGPVALKIVMGAAAVTAAGSVAVGGVEHAHKPRPKIPRAQAWLGAADASSPRTVGGVAVVAAPRRDAALAGGRLGGAKDMDDRDDRTRDLDDENGGRLAGGGHEGDGVLEGDGHHGGPVSSGARSGGGDGGDPRPRSGAPGEEDSSEQRGGVSGPSAAEPTDDDDEPDSSDQAGTAADGHPDVGEDDEGRAGSSGS